MNIRAPAEEKDAQYTAEKGGDECGLFSMLLEFGIAIGWH